MASKNNYLVALGLVITALAVPQVLGVTIPVPWDQTTDYTTFANGLTFAVGDTLEFKYSTATHSVSQVTKTNYDSCTGSSPIKHYSTGDDKVDLPTAGDYYFICPTAGHCAGGMKLAVTAVAASTPGSTPPTTSTNSSSPPPPSSAGNTPTTTTPSPPPPPSGNGASGVALSNFMLGASFVVATAIGFLC